MDGGQLLRNRDKKMREIRGELGWYNEKRGVKG